MVAAKFVPHRLRHLPPGERTLRLHLVRHQHVFVHHEGVAAPHRRGRVPPADTRVYNRRDTRTSRTLRLHVVRHQHVFVHHVCSTIMCISVRNKGIHSFIHSFTLVLGLGNRLDFRKYFKSLAKPLDDRLHNRFMGRLFENFLTWTAGRGSDINRHCIMDNINFF